MLLRILLLERRPGIEREAVVEAFCLWNDLMDEAFLRPTEFFDYDVTTDSCFSKTCSHAFIWLKSAFLDRVFNPDALIDLICLFDTEEQLSDIEHPSVEATLRRVQERVDGPSKLDIELVRCVQNLMRWYIQIFLRKGHKQLKDALNPWKEVGMLQLCLDLMEIPELGRFPSQLFFFSTFTAFPHDQDLSDAMGQLVTQHHLDVRLLSALARRTLAEDLWLLSLVRNVHNAVAGFPQQCLRPFELASTAVDSPWAHDNEHDCTYASALRGLGTAIFENNDRLSDLSIELVVEILRCCFAFRLGSKLLDEKWRTLIELTLTSKNKLCQNAGISVLVDAPTQYSLNSATVLGILSRELHDTDKGLIDDSDAAAIIPILTVLHKFCVANPEFRQAVRKGIFDDEQSYQVALKREIEKNGHLTARNAKPLDAPKGSLRSNLMRLMSCPHSIVKRLAGELLWSMLNGDKDEFIRRVGLGNALPFLSAKGLARLPC